MHAGRVEEASALAARIGREVVKNGARLRFTYTMYH